MPPRHVQVRGGAKALPAFSRWTFEALADRAAAAGGESGLQASAQVGTIEQGPTRSRQAASAADYLRGLAREEAALLGAGGADSGGLLLVPDSPEAAALARGESVPLRWEELRGGSDRLYLSQWRVGRAAFIRPHPSSLPAHSQVSTFSVMSSC